MGSQGSVDEPKVTLATLKTLSLYLIIGCQTQHTALIKEPSLEPGRNLCVH
jgi:hypothetical protein